MEVEGDASRVKSMVERARGYSNASAENAARAGSLLNKTDEAYRKALALSTVIRENASQVKSMVEDARDCANASAESASQSREIQNSTLQLHNGSLAILNQSSAVYNNMTLLAKEIQASAAARMSKNAP